MIITSKGTYKKLPESLGGPSAGSGIFPQILNTVLQLGEKKHKKRRGIFRVRDTHLPKLHPLPKQRSHQGEKKASPPPP